MSVTVVKNRSMGMPMLKPGKETNEFFLILFLSLLPSSHVIRAIRVVLNFDSLGLNGLIMALYLKKIKSKKSVKHYN